MSKEKAALQFAELEKKGTAHGKHFSLSPLIEALNTYADNYDKWGRARACDKMKYHLCKVVGGNQLLLPAHVANEYCHPTRPFYPCPTFEEETLPRHLEWDARETEWDEKWSAPGIFSATPKYLYKTVNWFTGEYNGGKLGDAFGVIRHTDRGPCIYQYEWHSMNSWYYQNHYYSDAKALLALSKIRQQQLEKLRVELQQVMYVKGLLNIYFPSALSTTILDYFGSQDKVEMPPLGRRKSMSIVIPCSIL